MSIRLAFHHKVFLIVGIGMAVLVSGIQYWAYRTWQNQTLTQTSRGATWQLNAVVHELRGVQNALYRALPTVTEQGEQAAFEKAQGILALMQPRAQVCLYAGQSRRLGGALCPSTPEHGVALSPDILAGEAHFTVGAALGEHSLVAVVPVAPLADILVEADQGWTLYAARNKGALVQAFPKSSVPVLMFFDALSGNSSLENWVYVKEKVGPQLELFLVKDKQAVLEEFYVAVMEHSAILISVFFAAFVVTLHFLFDLTVPTRQLLQLLRRGQHKIPPHVLDQLQEDVREVAATFNRLVDELSCSLSNYDLLAANVSDLIFRATLAEGTILYASPSVQSFLNSRTVPLTLWEWIHPEDQAVVKAAFQSFNPDHPEEVITCRLIREGGTVVWGEAKLKLIQREAANSEVVGIVRDVTERRGMEERLEKLATRDSLTGLANRHALIEALDLYCSIAGMRRFAVLLLDLDRFKHVNDTFGHAAGDALVAELGRRIAEAVPPGTLVARMGGDEFVIVCWADEVNPSTLAQKIIDSVSCPVATHNTTLYPHCSIGVAYYPDHGQGVYPLLKSADAAMYEAKRRGGGTFNVYLERSCLSAPALLSLETELHRALDDNRFVLHYQPIVEAGTGRLVGVEALLRMQSSEGKLINPLDFIPVAEQTGLIVPIGAWVLAKAARFAASWLHQGPRLRIAVNLSSRHFSSPRLFDHINEALSCGLPAELLELELTESMLMENLNQGLNVLHTLKSMGVTLSLDDFGTGYSSLAYLKFLPLDRLKIDRSFIRELPSNARDASIVHSILDLGHNLGLSVTGEGVETAEQATYLAAVDCDHLQGYYFARPMSEEACRQYIVTHCPTLVPIHEAHAKVARK